MKTHVAHCATMFVSAYVLFLTLLVHGNDNTEPFSVQEHKLFSEKDFEEMKKEGQSRSGENYIAWHAKFLEGRISQAADKDSALYGKRVLWQDYICLQRLDDALVLMRNAIRDTDGVSTATLHLAREAYLNTLFRKALSAESEKELQEYQEKGLRECDKIIEQAKREGQKTDTLLKQREFLSTKHIDTLCRSKDGRFLPYSERKRMQEEALKKAREKREQEAKKAGAPGGSGLTSATLTKGGLRPATTASGGCGCGSDQPTSATKSAASCGGCGSGDASPKPASSPPGGGCGCGSAQPATSTQPAAKPAGSSASSSGCGCGSPQPAAKPVESAASGSGCGCGSPQPAAKPAESSASNGGCGCGSPAPRGAAKQAAPRPGATAR